VVAACQYVRARVERASLVGAACGHVIDFSAFQDGTLRMVYAPCENERPVRDPQHRHSLLAGVVYHPVAGE
jgi:hypothetical protein